MSLAMTLVGTLGQLCLALMLFMLAVVAGAGLANNAVLAGWQMTLLNVSLFALPALCVLSAGVVIVGHVSGSSVLAYYWYLLPLTGVLPYLAFVLLLNR